MIDNKESIGIYCLSKEDGYKLLQNKEVSDEYKRRKMEGRQREFFISQLLDSINWCLMRMGISINEINPTKKMVMIM